MLVDTTVVQFVPIYHQGGSAKTTGGPYKQFFGPYKQIFCPTQKAVQIVQLCTNPLYSTPDIDYGSTDCPCFCVRVARFNNSS